MSWLTVGRTGPLWSRGESPEFLTFSSTPILSELAQVEEIEVESGWLWRSIPRLWSLGEGSREEGKNWV